MFHSVFKLAQGRSFPRVDFQVACDNIKSSIIIKLGAKPLMQWYTVRFPTPAMKTLTSTRNEEVCLSLKIYFCPNSKAFWDIIKVHRKYHIRHATLSDLESMLFLIQVGKYIL